ncbi:hypothetical protein K438DRAFT_1748863 [Mycena galopus ATCC 62051]|nr:hypothetical protein K438DRAFT_1748863 [Mycena galopus ATCC 62051]
MSSSIRLGDYASCGVPVDFRRTLTGQSGPRRTQGQYPKYSGNTVGSPLGLGDEDCVRLCSRPSMSRDRFREQIERDWKEESLDDDVPDEDITDLSPPSDNSRRIQKENWFPGPSPTFATLSWPPSLTAPFQQRGLNNRLRANALMVRFLEFSEYAPQSVGMLRQSRQQSV